LTLADGTEYDVYRDDDILGILEEPTKWMIDSWIFN
jgi:hypothetical protein